MPESAYVPTPVGTASSHGTLAFVFRLQSRPEEFDLDKNAFEGNDPN